MPVGVMLRSMDSAELTGWMAFLQVEAEKDRPADDADAWRKAFQAYG